jgi:hypothetical protein
MHPGSAARADRLPMSGPQVAAPHGDRVQPLHARHMTSPGPHHRGRRRALTPSVAVRGGGLLPCLQPGGWAHRVRPPSSGHNERFCTSFGRARGQRQMSAAPAQDSRSRQVRQRRRRKPALGPRAWLWPRRRGRAGQVRRSARSSRCRSGRPGARERAVGRQPVGSGGGVGRRRGCGPARDSALEAGHPAARGPTARPDGSVRRGRPSGSRERRAALHPGRDQAALTSFSWPVLTS